MKNTRHNLPANPWFHFRYGFIHTFSRSLLLAIFLGCLAVMAPPNFIPYPFGESLRLFVEDVTAIIEEIQSEFVEQRVGYLSPVSRLQFDEASRQLVPTNTPRPYAQRETKLPGSVLIDVTRQARRAGVSALLLDYEVVSTKQLTAIDDAARGPSNAQHPTVVTVAAVTTSEAPASSSDRCMPTDTHSLVNLPDVFSATSQVAPLKNVYFGHSELLPGGSDGVPRNICAFKSFRLDSATTPTLIVLPSLGFLTASHGTARIAKNGDPMPNAPLQCAARALGSFAFIQRSLQESDGWALQAVDRTCKTRLADPTSTQRAALDEPIHISYRHLSNENTMTWDKLQAVDRSARAKLYSPSGTTIFGSVDDYAQDRTNSPLRRSINGMDYHAYFVSMLSHGYEIDDVSQKFHDDLGHALKIVFGLVAVLIGSCFWASVGYVQAKTGVVKRVFGDDWTTELTWMRRRRFEFWEARPIRARMLRALMYLTAFVMFAIVAALWLLICVAVFAKIQSSGYSDELLVTMIAILVTSFVELWVQGAAITEAILGSFLAAGSHFITWLRSKIGFLKRASG